MVDITGFKYETLEVDYSITNSGDFGSVEDVELLIDGNVEYVDQDVMITDSAAGTLYWQADSAGTYTATVSIAGVTDQITVQVDLYVPDSGGTHQWNHLEKGGTTLGDSIGTLDATINGATWTSGLGTGGTHLDYDGVDDDSVLSGGASEFTHFTDAGTGTFFTWINPDTLDDSGVILGSTATTTEVGAYFVITGGDLRCSLYYGTSDVSTLAKASYPASAGEWAPVAFTADGSTLKVWAGDPITEIASDTLAGSTGSDWSNDPYFGYGPLTDYRHDGGMDLTFTDSDAWTQSELQSFVDDSREFYS